MLLRLTAAATFFLLVALPTGGAAQTPVVVELYTSQGCNSCPPADRLLSKLAQRDDVIPLALHVDYWDYLGWKDEFASPRFSARQTRYAVQTDRIRRTPQMIVDGLTRVNGARPMELMDTLQRHRGDALVRDLRLTRNGDRLTIRAPRTPALERPVLIQLVRFDPSRRIKILRGENRGRTLDYSNVVTSWEVLREWNGRAALSIAAEVPGDEAIAVILQYPGPGHIVGAAQLR